MTTIEDLASTIDPKVLALASKDEANNMIFEKIKDYIFNYVAGNYFHQEFKGKKNKFVSSTKLVGATSYYRIKFSDNKYKEYKEYVLRKDYRLLTKEERKENLKDKEPIAVLIGRFGLYSIQIDGFSPVQGFSKRNFDNIHYYAATSKEICAWELGMGIYYRIINMPDFRILSVEESIEKFNKNKNRLIKEYPNCTEV
jgi:hypothetical protein